MTLLIAILVAVVALWAVWHSFGFFWVRRRVPPEPIDEALAGVRVPRKRGPKDKAGAVALEEPDEGQDLSFPPRRQ